MRTATGKLVINLKAVQDNYALLQKEVGKKCTIAAVVKADAYGLGAIKIAEALIRAGCNHFFVANLAEALSLRAAYNQPAIYVLNGFYESSASVYIEKNLTPVLGSFIEIDSYKKLGRDLNQKLPAFLHFNTRMNRLGLGAVEQDDLWHDMSRLDGINIKGIMSHLACADEPQHEMNAVQLDLFKKIAAHFPNTPKVLANSSGIFCGPDFHFDMVRPGYALYGGNPLSGKKNPLKSVVSLHIPVIRTRIVYKDAVVGYGATYQFEKDTPIATLSAGYADGILRSLSNRGVLYWKGIRCPIRGRVSMDLTTVDLSDIPEHQRPRPGDMMELLGPHQDIDALATDAQTIGYEILTSLGHRYERIYSES